MKKCHGDWRPHSINGSLKCFKFGGRQDRDQAETICNTLGGQVPLPRNEAENTDYYNIMLNITTIFQYWPRLYMSPIGINDLKEEGQWVDKNGQKLNYTEWDLP